MSTHTLTAVSSDEHLAQLIAARNGTRRCLERAHTACTQLYVRHSPGLLAFLARHVPAAERDDLHQAVWSRVWQKLPDLFAGGDFRAWLFAIARNCVVDHSRKKAHLTSLDLQDVPDFRTPPAEQRLDEDERMAQLQRCLECLDPQSRQIVAARMMGTSYAEICASVGLSPLKAHKQFHRAKRQLMRCLKCPLECGASA
jgi:RNA polymerase sigma-70 factor (ECF subfamily)